MNRNVWFPEQFPEIEVEQFILKNAYKQYTADFTYINFFASNPFEDAFYLQMYQQGKTLTIAKSSLKRLSLGEERSHVLVEEATLSGILVNQLLHLLKSVKLNVFSMDENNVQWRDGESVELAVGRGFHKTTFSWWPDIDPTDWGMLDVIANKISGINKAVDYTFKTKQYFELVMDESPPSLVLEKLHEKSLLLTYEEVNSI